MIDNQLKAFHTFIKDMLTPISVDEMLLPRYVNWSTNFRDLPLYLQMASSCLKHIHSVLLLFTLGLMSLAACSRL